MNPSHPLRRVTPLPAYPQGGPTALDVQLHGPLASEEAAPAGSVASGAATSDELAYVLVVDVEARGGAADPAGPADPAPLPLPAPWRLRPRATRAGKWSHRRSSSCPVSWSTCGLRCDAGGGGPRIPAHPPHPSRTSRSPPPSRLRLHQRVVDSFREYVRPAVHPGLTPFCVQLTGIQQSWVDEAAPFPDVFKRFVTWVDRATGRVDGQRLLVATVGDWDLKASRRPSPSSRRELARPVTRGCPWAQSMLPRQAKQAGVSVPSFLKRWVNVKKVPSPLASLPAPSTPRPPPDTRRRCSLRSTKGGAGA